MSDQMTLLPVKSNNFRKGHLLKMNIYTNDKNWKTTLKVYVAKLHIHGNTIHLQSPLMENYVFINS